MKRALTPIAGALVAVYLVLAIQAAVCLFAYPAAPVGGHHHHQHSGEAAHSLLCVWACQANSEPSLTSIPPVVALLFLGVTLVPIPSVSLFGVRLDFIRSRAPPR